MTHCVFRCNLTLTRPIRSFCTISSQHCLSRTISMDSIQLSHYCRLRLRKHIHQFSSRCKLYEKLGRLLIVLSRHYVSFMRYFRSKSLLLFIYCAIRSSAKDFGCIKKAVNRRNAHRGDDQLDDQLQIRFVHTLSVMLACDPKLGSLSLFPTVLS